MTKQHTETPELRLNKFFASYASLYGESERDFANRFTTKIERSALLFDEEFEFKLADWMPIPAIFRIGDTLDLVKRLESKDPPGVYRQVASSWLTALALQVRDNERILDACAAPGGKTLLLSQMANNLQIVANDASKERLQRTRYLLKRYGVVGVTFKQHKAEHLTRYLENSLFDKILLDVPCSGEGEIYTKDLKTFQGWNRKRIIRLVHEQRRILNECWRLLKVGGRLVYSTCTISPEENELQIQRLLNSHPEAKIVPLKFDKSVPTKSIVSSWGNSRLVVSELVRQGTVRVAHQEGFEAFYIAAMEKSSLGVDTNDVMYSFPTR